MPKRNPATHEQALRNPHDAALAPSCLPYRVQQAIMVLFVVGVVASGVFSLTEHWRRATLTLGLAMVGLAGARLVCDSRAVGVFAVRSRKFDCSFSLVLGAAMILIAVSVDSLGS